MRRRKKINNKLKIALAAILILYCVAFIIFMMKYMGSPIGISIKAGLATVLIHIFAIVFIIVKTYDSL